MSEQTNCAHLSVKHLAVRNPDGTFRGVWKCQLCGKESQFPQAPFNDEEISAACADILAERRRQIAAEGWSAEHDDGHTDGELASAAACYAHFAKRTLTTTPLWWPWSSEGWKQKDRRHDLVKAGALILAEIERLDRQTKKEAL